MANNKLGELVLLSVTGKRLKYYNLERGPEFLLEEGEVHVAGKFKNFKNKKFVQR